MADKTHIEWTNDWHTITAAKRIGIEVSEYRHEYDHYLGYSAKHQLDVEAVCSKCHHNREDARRGS